MGGGQRGGCDGHCMGLEGGRLEKGSEGGRELAATEIRRTMCSVEWWFERCPPVEGDGSISWSTSVFLISYVILVNWFFFQVLRDNAKDEGWIACTG